MFRYLTNSYQSKRKNREQRSIKCFKSITKAFNYRWRILGKSLRNYHLLDFSWENSQTVAHFLAKEPFSYKSDYLEHFSICQELFYYLRAYHSGSITDQEILEEIERRYQKYQGDVEALQGSFEDFPELEEEE